MKEGGIELIGVQYLDKINGGESEIRTHERVAPLPVFKTGAFNRSAISPFKAYYSFILKMSKY